MTSVCGPGGWVGPATGGGVAEADAPGDPLARGEGDVPGDADEPGPQPVRLIAVTSTRPNLTRCRCAATVLSVNRPCAACDDAAMIEYGGGIEQGPAGQVSGGQPIGGSGSVDLGGSVGNAIGDVVNQVTTMEPVWLVIWIAVAFVGLVILRRAF
jgi:hypothetical protein